MGTEENKRVMESFFATMNGGEVGAFGNACAEEGKTDGICGGVRSCEGAT
jgi:hypothetical protein